MTIHDILNVNSGQVVSLYHWISIHDILNVYVGWAASYAAGCEFKTLGGFGEFGKFSGFGGFGKLLCQVGTGHSIIWLDKGSGQW